MNILTLLKPTLIKKIKKNVAKKTTATIQSIFILIDFRTNATQYDLHTTAGEKISGSSSEKSTTAIFQSLCENKIEKLKALLFLEVLINLDSEEIKAEVFYLDSADEKKTEQFIF